MAELEETCSATPVLASDIDPSWFNALEPEFGKKYFQELSNFVVDARRKSTVYPAPGNVFSWTRHCPVDGVKVVILGQDPYHGPKQAHGLCFSVQPGVPPPPSLENIYKELEADILGFQAPEHGHLVGWAQQGVLMLNAVLTVEDGTPKSHQGKGWEKFTDAVLQVVAKQNKGVVFLLWGDDAKNMISRIKMDGHHSLEAAHPSPRSAAKGFFGCKHFSKCNKLLDDPIDWKRVMTQSTGTSNLRLPQLEGRSTLL